MTRREPADVTGVFVYLASEASREMTGESIEAQTWLNTNPTWR